MRREINHVILTPKQFFGAPYAAALFNAAASGMLGLPIVASGMNPLWVVVPFGIAHLMLSMYGAREPDFPEVVMAWNNSRSNTRNIISEKGRVYLP